MDVYKMKWHVVPDISFNAWGIGVRPAPDFRYLKSGQDVIGMIAERDLAQHIVNLHNARLEQVRG